MFDLMGMMGKVKELQSKIKEVKEGMVHLTAEGEAGAGMVKVKVNGNRQVLSVDIDTALLNSADKNVVQDLTVAAINKALENIDEKIKTEFKQKTEGLIPSIPGMDLGNLMGGL
ncbi:MAG: YbaB/EbfC family nucleoid-associated protein [Cytophagaceae bacterium]|jgi:hypothetical protein|nr:YbaB/EbfC family nucleoid-associated protein [Cytophagaceae bacterium]